MKTSDFDYHLPPECIAQTPLEPRDRSRLMVVSRSTGSLEHRHFHDLADWLRPGDVLVCNDSRVIPARLQGQKAEGGGKVELLLLRRLDRGIWETLARPARRLREGTVIVVGSEPPIEAEVMAKTETGTVVVSLADEEALEAVGMVPLPPYIHVPLSGSERYQTVYSSRKGSVAAPTAGLHFTPELMGRLQEKDVRFVFVTLHLALDSFRPVRTDNLADHTMHSEYCELGDDVAETLNRAREDGRRIVCVGTSAVRVIESAAASGEGRVVPFSGWTDLFILPGHRFHAVDALITNFHLPRSTLLMLVSAFAGRELVLRSYREAIERGYRFYSFGDATLIT
jgi:S-adenosylmethionine:tRNA ribosyltransferase-isomerase